MHITIDLLYEKRDKFHHSSVCDTSRSVFNTTFSVYNTILSVFRTIFNV